ncbi:MAG: peptidoglycan-binding protein [Myxococcota bacterium]|nr:peptidoglycan-binding protein [Myxococcota bacterium]
MRPYVVRPGDHLLKLAERLRFNAAQVWHAPENKELRDSRGDGHILQSGDVLNVPDLQPPKWQAVNVGQVNTFVATVQRVSIRVQFLWSGRPLASKPCSVRELPEMNGLSTDGQGLLELEVPVYLDGVTVDFVDPAVSQELRVGGLDPVSTGSGVAQRLANLGHLRTIGSHGGEVERDELAAAVRRFQWSRQLPITGEVDDKTREAIQSAHGC